MKLTDCFMASVKTYGQEWSQIPPKIRRLHWYVLYV